MLSYSWMCETKWPNMREGLKATNLDRKFSCTVSGLTRRSYNKEIHILNIYTMKPYSHIQDAKKVIFTACHSDQLKIAFTGPKVISTSPETFLWADLISQTLLYFEFLKKLDLRTEFTSPIAKSTNPELLDTTFFARWHNCFFHLHSQPELTLSLWELHQFFCTSILKKNIFW